ncbi:DUF3108 domain-containing protein [Pelagibacterales bacterium SAG-MED31]|nr:DUF3108 domain-containing protein [Pelagibacterales bacterium SAG-MED31]
MHKKYIVKVGGIKIGELNWQIKINDDEYLNRLELYSKGLISSIYSFKGEYFSQGEVYKKELIPKKYTHLWETKKVVKKMALMFDKNKLITIKQSPNENEEIRLNVFDIINTNDPLTSFLKIILGKKSLFVVDGRRLYTMTSRSIKNQTEIEISEYFNLWADHKRNKFEKIIFEKKGGEILPHKISIHFDGKVFRLEEI